MTAYYSPVGNDQVFDSNGDPLVGGYWETYLAGTTTPTTVWTSNTGLVAQPAQIIINADGRTTNTIWLTAGQAVKFRLFSALGAILLTVDNILGIGDQTATPPDEWVLLGISPTYLSATSFSVPGDQRPILQQYRRVKTINAGGTVYSTILTSVFTTLTTVTLANDDSASLDSDLSAAYYGLLSADNDAIPRIFAPMNARTFGAVGDGVTDDTAALQTAITAAAGKALYVPAGVYMHTLLTIPADTLIEGDGYATQFKKNADGVMMNLGARSELRSLYLAGNGASFTGTGVLIDSGSLDDTSWRKLNNVTIRDTVSYCLEFSGATAGYSSQVSDCRFVPRPIAGSYSVYAIKLPSNGGVTESGGNRMFNNVWTFASRIADLADSENCQFIGCQGFWPLFAAGTTKAVLTGGRLNLFDSGAIFTGTANTVSGITMNYNVGAALTISSGCINCRFDSSVAIGSGATITDNSDGKTSGNEIYLPSVVYTPTWAGTGGAPTIGDGSIGASYTRRGGLVNVNLFLRPGASTNFATATAWTFSLPYISSRTTTGSAYLLDSGTSHYSATSKIEGNAQTVSVFSTGAGAGVGYNFPFTWAASDILQLDIEYEIK